MIQLATKPGTYAMMDKNESETLVEGVSNKNYAADLNFSIKYTRWFLTLLGIWPDVISNSTRIERFVSRLLMPFPSTVITIILIPLASVPFFHNLTATQNLLLLAPLSFRVTSVMKNLVLISRRGGIKFCIRHMETDWRTIDNDKHRDIMIRNLRFGHSLTVMSVVCLYSGAVFYNIMPFVSPRKINSLNETVRPMTVPGVEIYVDLRAGRNYEIVIFTSWLSAFYTSAIVTAICNLAAVLVCHACGQIEIVMTRLESLVGNEDSAEPERTIQNRIGLIIQSHSRVLGFASKIDQVLRELCLIEVVAATLIICLVAYLCIMERKNTGMMALISYTTLLVSLSYNIFIFCQIGELLKEQAVGKTAYMTEWYRLPGKTGLALVMLIAIANYPRRLTAGRILELSITTFGNIMKNSFGYFNMLRTMTER